MYFFTKLPSTIKVVGKAFILQRNVLELAAFLPTEKLGNHRYFRAAAGVFIISSKKTA